MRRLLTEQQHGWVAAISLAIFVILSAGYCASLSVGRVSLAGSPVSREDFHLIELARGRFVFAVGSVAPAPTGFAPGFTWRIRLRKPDFRRFIWEFDAHRFAAPPGGTAYILAFPIWCGLLPCLIAPLLWLRKRRRSDPVGFDVIASSP